MFILISHNISLYLGIVKICFAEVCSLITIDFSFVIQLLWYINVSEKRYCRYIFRGLCGYRWTTNSNVQRFWVHNLNIVCQLIMIGNVKICLGYHTSTSNSFYVMNKISKVNRCKLLYWTKKINILKKMHGSKTWKVLMKGLLLKPTCGKIDIS